MNSLKKKTNLKSFAIRISFLNRNKNLELSKIFDSSCETMQWFFCYQRFKDRNKRFRWYLVTTFDLPFEEIIWLINNMKNKCNTEFTSN